MQISFEHFIEGHWESSASPQPEGVMYATPDDWFSLLQRIAIQIQQNILTDNAADPRPRKPDESAVLFWLASRSDDLADTLFAAQRVSFFSKEHLYNTLLSRARVLFDLIDMFYLCMFSTQKELNLRYNENQMRDQLSELKKEMARFFNENKDKFTMTYALQLVLTNEIGSFFEKNEINYTMAYPLQLPYWQKRLSTEDMRTATANFFNPEHQDYGNFIPVIQIMLAREQNFLRARLVQKSYCQERLPSELYTAFLRIIFPIFQQTHMSEIGVMCDKLAGFLSKYPNSAPSPSPLICLLLNKLTNAQEADDFLALIDKLGSLIVQDPLWFTFLSRLEHIHGYRFCIQQISHLLDLVHAKFADKLADILNVLNYTKNLSVEKIFEILSKESLEKINEALALADAAYFKQVELAKRMRTVQTILADNILHSRVVSVLDSNEMRRDWLYVKAMVYEGHPIYYQRVEDSGRKILNCLTLTSAEYPQLLDTSCWILRAEAEATDAKMAWRSTLQCVALLSALYRKTNEHTQLPNAKCIEALLYRLQQPDSSASLSLNLSSMEYAWVLMMLTAIGSLRTGTTYIEWSEHHPIRFNDEKLQLFYHALGLSIQWASKPEKLTLVSARQGMGVRNRAAIDVTQSGIQCEINLVRMINTPDLAMYMQSRGLHMQTVVLRYFDAFASVMMANLDGQNVIHSNRRLLLNAIHAARANFFESISVDTLVEADEQMERFQRELLLPIWNIHKDNLLMLRALLRLTPELDRQIDILTTQSEQLEADLKRPFLNRFDKRPRLIHPTLTVDNLPGAVLSYDGSVVSPKVKHYWQEQQFQVHMKKLLKLCGLNGYAFSMHFQDLNNLIDHLLQSLSKEANDEKLITVVVACIQLCRSMSLEGSDDKIASLELSVRRHYGKLIADNVCKNTVWLTKKETFYYRWFECQAVKNAGQELYDLANQLQKEPDNMIRVMRFHQALHKHALILKQSRYFPWAWLFGYPDMQKLIAQAIDDFNDMVKIGLYPSALAKEGEESALCAFNLIVFNNRLTGVVVSERQHVAWQDVLARVDRLKNQYTGMGLLYELKQYLSTQRGQFRRASNAYFCNSQIDPIAELLRDIELPLAQPSSAEILTQSRYLSEKEKALQETQDKPGSIAIQVGCAGQHHYFDMWLKPEGDGSAEHCKRFYNEAELVAFEPRSTPAK